MENKINTSSQFIPQESQHLVIGMSGYTGCGKSFISELLRKHFTSIGIPCRILSADVMARQLRDENPQVKQNIIEILGPEVYDSESGISVPKLINDIIFKPENLRKKKQYESIFNFEIQNEVLKNIQQMLNNDSQKDEESKGRLKDVLILDFYCIFSYLPSCIPYISRFILVTCSQETQLKRLCSSTGRNIDPELAKKRIEVQMKAEPLDWIKKQVQFTFENEEDKDPNESVTKIANQLLLEFN